MLKNLLIWIVAITIAAVATTTAIGAVTKNKQPTIALALSPKNGFAVENVAANQTRIYASENQGKFPERVTRPLVALSIMAFESEPATPDAIGVLALSRAETVRRSMMQKSFELSRRQKLATSWMIIDSGKRGDLPDVLDKYDVTLRTSSTAVEAIIPVLASALVNEEAVEPFATLLSRNPLWASHFWQEVVQVPGALVNAAKLRMLLEDSIGEHGINQDPALVYALVRAQKFEEAEALYEFLTSKGRKESGLIHNSDFSKNSTFPPFDWQVFSTGEYGAAISHGNMNISAISDAGGAMARQLVRLPKDTLTLQVELAAPVPKGASVNVEFACADKLRSSSTKIKVPLSEKLTQQTIDNRQGSCSYYWVAINGKSSGNDNGFDIIISNFEIT